MSSTPDDHTTSTAPILADEPATVAADRPAPDADVDAPLDELAPNGGGTSGNHGNGTAG